MIYETCSMYITTSIKYIHMCIHITFSVLIKPLWRRCLKTFLNKLYENWTFSSHFGSLQHFWKLSNKRCRGLYPMDSMWNILYITAMLRKLEYVTPFSRPSDGLSIKIKRKSKLLSWLQNAYDRSKSNHIWFLLTPWNSQLVYTEGWFQLQITCRWSSIFSVLVKLRQNFLNQRQSLEWMIFTCICMYVCICVLYVG